MARRVDSGRPGATERDARPSTQPGQRDLTAGPIGTTLLAFALPTLGSNILQSLNGSINAIWVGRFLGEGALAATSQRQHHHVPDVRRVFGFGMASTILIGQASGAATSTARGARSARRSGWSSAARS